MNETMYVTNGFLCLCVELELSKVQLLSEHHTQSPKSKALRTATARRRKRPLRQQHLDEALSPVTTPEDDKSVVHRIKHVAGVTSAKPLSERLQTSLFCRHLFALTR